jgi:hypothetical protein
MHQADYLSGQSGAAKSTRSGHEEFFSSVDENIVAFLVTSAEYLFMPAERLAQPEQQNDLK